MNNVINFKKRNQKVVQHIAERFKQHVLGELMSLQLFEFFPLLESEDSDFLEKILEKTAEKVVAGDMPLHMEEEDT